MGNRKYPKPLEKNGQFVCPVCGHSTGTQDGYRSHFRRKLDRGHGEHQEAFDNFSGGLAQYEDQDGIKGRPIRLNKRRLELKEEKEYAELVFFGDLHYGHPSCDIERATRMRDYCVDNSVYVLGMGDYMEAGTRRSIGDSVYQQDLNPQEQLEFFMGFFRPLAKKNLLLGLLLGNHESRILKETSVNPVKLLAKDLGVRYLGSAIWNLFYVGDRSYTVYSLHGSSGSRFLHTKMKAVKDVGRTVNADLIVYGHVHEKAEASTLEQYVDKRDRTVKEEKKFYILTGHYLDYDDSYAQERGYPIGKQGSPKVKLFGDRYDVHIST